MDTNPSRLFFAVLLLALLTACASGPADSGAATLLVLHTNDLHSNLLPHPDGEGGLARIAGYVANERARRADVLFLDAGDGVTGTPVSSIFGGRPIFHVMSVMGYDAMALGNHEFDHDWSRIEEYRRIAGFPILCANARGPDGSLLADAAYRIFTVKGLDVAVIGILTPTTPQHTARGLTEGCEFLPAQSTIEALLPELEPQADLIVVLSHLGIEHDRLLAAAVPEIDLIVGGHSHTELTAPEIIGKTVVVQALAEGRRIGRLELRIDRDRGEIIAVNGSLITVDDRLPADRAVVGAVAVWEDQVSEQVSEVLGRAARDIGLVELRAHAARVFREVLGTDLGFQNEGAIRAVITAGPIRVRDVWNVHPFDNTLVTLRIRGDALPAWAIEELGSVTPDRIYTVATNSYVPGHLERYFPDGILGTVDSGRPMRDAIIDAVRAEGGFESAGF